MAQQMDIGLQRNEDFARSLFITDSAGIAADITGCTFAMQVKERLSNAVTLASAEITIIDGAGGALDLILRASEGSTLSEYGDPLHTYRLPYDLRITYPDGIREVLIAGWVVLSRGKTYA